MGTAYIELLATVLWMVSFRAAYLAWAWGSGAAALAYWRATLCRAKTRTLL